MPLSDEQITRLLAEKVMGWTVGDHPEKHGHGQWYSEYDSRAYFKDGTFLRSSSGWYPLEEIETAWEVWQKLAEWGLVEIATAATTSCRFRRLVLSAPCRERGEAVGEETAPRAICVCALRAVGVEPEGEP